MTNDNILVALQAIGNRHSHLNLSLRNIARLLGVSASYLTRIANGERPPAEELANPAIWVNALATVGVPPEDLRALSEAVEEAVEARPQRPKKPTYFEIEEELRDCLEKRAEDTATVGPLGDVFTGPYSQIAVASVAAALKADLALSADTDCGAMVDAGTDRKAIPSVPLEYYVECRGGGSLHQDTTSPDAQIVATEFVRHVGGLAAMNAIIKSVKRKGW